MKEAIHLHLHLSKGVSKENSKTTIDYNNILIKLQLSYITVVSNSKTHSKRPACINDSRRYYIVFALPGYIVSIIVYLLSLVIIEIHLLSKGVS